MCPWRKSKSTRQITTAAPKPNLPSVTVSYTTLYIPKPASTGTPYVSKFHEDLESDENGQHFTYRTHQNLHGKVIAQLPEGSKYPKVSSDDPTTITNDKFYDCLQQNASTSTLASHHTARTHQSSFSASLKRISSKQSTPDRASPLTPISREPSNLGSPWIFTDGEPVEDDWVICGDAERMSARNREKVSRSTHNSRMREALLAHGRGAGARAVSESQRR